MVALPWCLPSVTSVEGTGARAGGAVGAGRGRRASGKQQRDRLIDHEFFVWVLRRPTGCVVPAHVPRDQIMAA